MCRFEGIRTLAAFSAVLLLGACDVADKPAAEAAAAFGLGRTLPDQGASIVRTAIPPDGEGLPEGSGDYDEGRRIYNGRCASCHGPELEGTVLGMPLVGGRGTLRSDSPRKTVESFWPYAPPLFSYIRNTMPITAPGSLDNDEVYALMAYILASARIISRDQIMNRDSLPAVVMPNRNGFIPDPRPDTL